MTPIEAVRNLTKAAAAAEAARLAFASNRDPATDAALRAEMIAAVRARSEAERLRRQFAPRR